jgi:hypothetical protein
LAGVVAGFFDFFGFLTFSGGSGMREAIRFLAADPSAS